MPKKKVKKLENRNIDSSLKKYLFWAIIVALLIVSIWIIKPFAIALISAFIFAYLIKPVYLFLSKRMGKSISAILSILALILIVIIPLTLISGALISQINLSQNFDINKVITSTSILSFLDKYNLNDLKSNALSFFLVLITSLATYLPYLLISALVTLLGTYYTLINWDKLSSYLEAMLPFGERSRIRSEISKITDAIVFGYLLKALIAFLVAGLGFYLSGVSSFILLASLIALFSFVPVVGWAIIWIPMLIYYALYHNYFSFIGVLITGLIISVVVDNWIFMRVAGKKSKIHPLIFLLGVLGGVSIFGIFGFIIGPLILTYSIKLIEESIKSRRR